ncbi:lysozyme inhibitor LprI family protein [Roseibium sp.]|uniref:lysozyme inhibitor LprI family protein n=1 Tax=Roseibium sp. TaxID=1936156 RepID=UPI003B5121C1
MFKTQIMTLLCLCMSWALTAEAQEVQYSSQPLDACLQSATTALEEQGCIGLASQVCQSANDLGGTTVGMVACGSKEAEFWDKKLNEIYGSLVKKAEASDREMKEIGATVPQILPALRDMQRAWITYRDRTCDYEYSQWGGGTGGGPAIVACQSRMTALQYIYLKHSWPFDN